MNALADVLDTDLVPVHFTGVDGPYYQPSSEIGPAYVYWRVFLPNGLSVGRCRSEDHARRVVAESCRMGATVASLRRVWDAA